MVIARHSSDACHVEDEAGMKHLFLAPIVAAAIVHWAQPATARDHIWIVSSSASEPFTKAVAERVAKAAGGPAPVVENTGTALGLAYLCAGGDLDHPDAASVVRRLKKDEFDLCRRNGVTDLVEIPVGLDLLVIAQSKAGPAMQLTFGQIYMALARLLPDESGAIAPNLHQMWSQADRALPAVRIDVRVLPGLSDSRESLQDLFLQKGALKIPNVAKFWAKGGTVPDSVRFLRDDHPFVVLHESEEAIVRELVAHPGALGIVGYRFLETNKATLRGVGIEGADPTPENAYAGKYPGTRKLYLYVRKARLDTVRGLKRLGAEYVSREALGPGGYLLAIGFVPLGMEDMIKTMSLVEAMPPLLRDALSD
jgi:phosphate transport system substrate-binding protein